MGHPWGDSTINGPCVWVGGGYGDLVQARTTLTLGAGSGLVGLVLLIVEAVRVLNGSTLNTLNSALLFVGLGLLAVGGVLLVMAVVAVEDAGLEPTAGTGVADATETTADETAAPAT